MKRERGKGRKQLQDKKGSQDSIDKLKTKDKNDKDGSDDEDTPPEIRDVNWEEFSDPKYKDLLDKNEPDPDLKPWTGKKIKGKSGGNKETRWIPTNFQGLDLKNDLQDKLYTGPSLINPNWNRKDSHLASQTKEEITLRDILDASSSKMSDWVRSLIGGN